MSQEGVREHTYELLQDYTINMGGWSKRVRRGQRYDGRIFVDHAEIDISGVSYTVLRAFCLHRKIEKGFGNNR